MDVAWGRACADGAYTGGACADGGYTDGACVGRVCAGGACDVIYSKSPTSLGDSRFIYIKGPIKIPLSLEEVKNLLVLIWSRTSSLVYSVWFFSYSILYKDRAIITYLLTHTPL